MVSTSTAQTTIDILQQYGGWGLSVILMGVIWYMFNFYNNKIDKITDENRIEMNKKEEKYGDKLDQRHDEYRGILQTTCELLGSIQEGFKYCQERNR